ncbi:hypothetical protein LXA43DRAFT_1027506 [Ganoderma leucocontextum]|nr:hypothetical protein LXA43DRAFT_1027506 [Ganoderma leucocontextum]
MKNPFKKKRASVACNYCSSKKVACDAPGGIGTSCKRCNKASRDCTWDLTTVHGLEGPQNQSGVRSGSCTSCKAKKMRCRRAPSGGNKSCGTCAMNRLPCSFIEVAGPTLAQEPDAGPSNQGAAASYYLTPQYQFGDGAASVAYPPLLSIDTSSTMAGGSAGSVTPSSGPSSPRSWLDTVLIQEYSLE